MLLRQVCHCLHREVHAVQRLEVLLKYTSCKVAGAKEEGLRKLAWPGATAVLRLCCCEVQPVRRAQLLEAGGSAIPAAIVCSQIPRTCTATAAGYENSSKV
jgi:hypothetical protein